MYIIIPDDIIVEILLRLPAKSLFNFRCVCKYWFNLISDSVFIKKHLHHHQHEQRNHSILVFDSRPSAESADQILLHSLIYDNNSIDDEAAKWVSICSPINWQMFTFTVYDYLPLGSCNGLLCIHASGFWNDRIGLLNPCTKQYKELPHHDQQVVPPTYKFCHTTYGFGYDRINNDYKVVKNSFYTLEDDYYSEDCYDYVTVVDVYTLGTNSWRRIEDLFPYEFKDVKGVLVGGALYWTAEKIGFMDLYDLYIIVGFKLGDEVHKEISVPPQCAHHQDRFMKLEELNRCLCIFQHTSSDTIEVWTLMNKDNSDDWAKLFTIAEPKLVMLHRCRRFSPLGVRNKDEEFLMKVENKELVWYNPRDEKTRFLADIPSNGYGNCNQAVVTYTESLVSLKWVGN